MRTRLRAGPFLGWLLLISPVLISPASGAVDSANVAQAINGSLLCYIKGAAAVTRLQELGAADSDSASLDSTRTNAVARIQASEECIRELSASIPAESPQDVELKRTLAQALANLRFQKELAARQADADLDQAVLHSLRLRERTLNHWLVRHQQIDAEYRTVYAQLAALISQRRQMDFMQALSQGQAVDPYKTDRDIENWLSLVSRELSTVATLEHSALEYTVDVDAESEVVELLTDLAALEKHAWQVLAALSSDEFRNEKLLALRSIRRRIQDVHIRLTELMGAEAVPVIVDG